MDSSSCHLYGVNFPTKSPLIWLSMGFFISFMANKVDKNESGDKAFVS